MIPKISSITTSKIFTFILIVIGFLIFVLHPASTNLMDLNVYIEAGQRLTSGISPYTSPYYAPGSTPDTSFELYYFYPPPLAIFFSLLTKINKNAIYFFWCLGSYVAFLFSLVTLGKIHLKKINIAGVDIEPTCLAIFLGISFEPFFWGIMEGQVNAFLLLFLVIAYKYALRSEFRITGALITAAAWIKVVPIFLLLPFLLNRASALITTRGSLLFSIVTFMYCLTIAPFRLFFDFFNNALLVANFIDGRYLFNFSLLKSFSEVNIFPFSYVIFVFTLITLLCLLIYINRGDISKSYSMSICGMLLISPTLWFHHLVWLLIPLFVLAGTVRSYRDATIFLALFFCFSKVMEINYLTFNSYPNMLPLSRSLPVLLIILLIYLLHKGNAGEKGTR